MGTFIVLLIVAAAVILAVRSILKDKGGCSGCSGCGSSCHCHSSAGEEIKKLVKESRIRHSQ